MEGQEAVGQPPAEGQADVSEPQAPSIQAELEQLKAEHQKLQGRYEESSKEGKRLATALQEFKAHEASSLKEAQPMAEGTPSFPNRDQFVQYAMEKHDFTERQAQRQYEVEKYTFERLQTLEMANRALANQMKFQTSQLEGTIEGANPELKQANEFFKGTALESLPPTERIQQYRLMVEKIKPLTGGRDLSAIKGAAGTSVGGAGSRTAVDTGASNDQFAKQNGFPSYKAMIEMNSVKTPEDMANWNKKWKK